MKEPRHLLMALCCCLALMSPPGFAETAAAGDDASAEDKARSYFTDLEVIDQNGERLRFYSDVLKDRVVLINFIFTNCPDACPLMTQKLIQTRALLVDAVRDDVWFVSISIDPERDTPEAMKTFAEKQGADQERWIWLTGSKQNLDFIVKRLGQYTDEVEAHSTLMLAANTRTRHWTRVMPMVPPAGIAQQMRALAEESPG
jgi:protein SCO1/2